MTYEDKIKQVVQDLAEKNGSVSATEVHNEMHKRKWISPLDTVLDIHKLMVEILGPPNRENHRTH